MRSTIRVARPAGAVRSRFTDEGEGAEPMARLRACRMEDLLGRAPVELMLPELALDLAGRRVLITGAAGSIGSELARQVARHHPGNLVLFDRDETQLFYLELELEAAHPDLRLTAVIGDITDRVAVARAFQRYRPARVFHAAAYKHVPMMETNAREALRNNVIGAYHVASVSGAYGAEKFVLMSTDKAVRPCSVMGASKRLAELAVLGLQDAYPDTAYCGVRFGNVLGSRGSVLPIFLRQVEADLPLTVTHPDVTRYFMTIPEAVQLILQATLLPAIRGNLAMLEMGEPVRIVELAQNFLRLIGRENGNGHGIVFTGLRPGERLHEELVAPDEATLATSVPKVRLLMTPRTLNGSGGIGRLMPRWTRLIEAGAEAEVLTYLRKHFPELRFAASCCEIGPAPADEAAARSAQPGSASLVAGVSAGVS
ncbi:MAG TPA: polysaccharide biosynthesis protein [Longimicrobiales bacterium]